MSKFSSDVNSVPLGAGAHVSPGGAPKKTSGLAIASLIIGVLAIIGSWLPILNNISFFFAIVGLILGIVGLFAVLKGKKSGKGLAIAGVVLNLLAIVITLATQSLYSKVIDEALSPTEVASVSESQPADNDESEDAAVDSQKESTAKELAIGGSITLENGLTVSVNSVEDAVDEFGDAYKLVTVTYTNGSSETIDFNPFDWKSGNESGVLNEYELAVFPKDDVAMLESGSLNADGTVTGAIPFKQDSTSVHYYSDMFTDEATATWKLQ